MSGEHRPIIKNAMRLNNIRNNIKFIEQDIKRFRGSKIDDGPARVSRLMVKLHDHKELLVVLEL